MVTVLRSPSNDALSSESLTVMEGSDVSSRDAEDTDVSAFVHCPQNLKSRGFSKPHFGQTSARAVVHCTQNLIPAGFSNPHFEQRITVTRPLPRETLQTKPLVYQFPSLQIEEKGWSQTSPWTETIRNSLTRWSSYSPDEPRLHRRRGLREDIREIACLPT
jgi:hypothetical protein